MKCNNCKTEIPQSLLKKYPAHSPSLKCPRCGNNPYTIKKQISSGVTHSGGFWNITGKILTEIVKGLF